MIFEGFLKQSLNQWRNESQDETKVEHDKATCRQRPEWSYNSVNQINNGGPDDMGFE